MPVTFEIFPDRSLSIVTFAGPFTVEETEATLASFRAQGGQSYPCIFEFDRPVANFRPENIKRLVSDMAPAGGGICSHGQGRHGHNDGGEVPDHTHGAQRAPRARD